MKKLCMLLLVFIMMALPLAGVVAQDPAGTLSGQMNVRTGPGRDQQILSELMPGTRVLIEGRSEIGDWVLIHTEDNAVRGWVASRYVILDAGLVLQNLPVTGEVLEYTPPAAAVDPNAPPPIDGTNNDPNVGEIPLYTLPDIVHQDNATLIAYLESIPPLHNMVNGTVRNIFAHGQALHNNARIFTTVGDSISNTQPFLVGFGSNNYDLAAYGHLQPTIDYFLNNPTRTAPNPFTHNSMATESAFNTAGVLDIIWTDPRYCETNEAPLLCEYRLVKPSVAIIMLGSVDIQIIEVDLYARIMNWILKLTIDRGIVPVVTTFPVREDYLYYDKSLRFNAALVELANQHGIPVINLWKAARPLPGNGTRDDRFHLSQGPTFFTFNGEENQYGTTLRNLLTLQALDAIRQGVLPE